MKFCMKAILNKMRDSLIEVTEIILMRLTRHYEMQQDVCFANSN